MFKTKKSLGQNFLINSHILDKITSGADINEDDVIVEVGPGMGNLTSRLAKKAKKVIAIEKDHRLIPMLRENLKELTNVEIIEADVLKIDSTALLRSLAPDPLQPTALLRYCANYKIVGNIPYYITSHFIRKIFEEWEQPKLVVLTVQKEVAQRILAKPPHTNLLALSVQYYSEPNIVGQISKNNFRPVPKIDSTIISLKPKVQGLRPEEAERLFKIIKIGFSEKRKQLLPILSKKLKIEREKLLAIFEKEGIDGKARAENLSLEQWVKLSQIIHFLN